MHPQESNSEFFSCAVYHMEGNVFMEKKWTHSVKKTGDVFYLK
jgi:hypothetical protein